VERVLSTKQAEEGTGIDPRQRKIEANVRFSINIRNISSACLLPAMCRMDSKLVPAQFRSAVIAVVMVVVASVLPFQARAQSVSLDPAKMPRIGNVDERFVSYNIEMAEVTGGNFWKPLLNQDLAQKFFAHVEEQAVGQMSHAFCAQFVGHECQSVRRRRNQRRNQLSLRIVVLVHSG